MCIPVSTGGQNRGQAPEEADCAVSALPSANTLLQILLYVTLCTYTKAEHQFRLMPPTLKCHPQEQPNLLLLSSNLLFQQRGAWIPQSALPVLTDSIPGHMYSGFWTEKPYRRGKQLYHVMSSSFRLLQTPHISKVAEGSNFPPNPCRKAD